MQVKRASGGKCHIPSVDIKLSPYGKTNLGEVHNLLRLLGLLVCSAHMGA